MKFDGIIADPPYGIREKSSKVGVKKDKDGNVYPQQPHDNHYPEKAKYSLNQAFIDIMDLAAVKLVVAGRVAFWFPVARDTYNENVLPRHEALQLIDNCEQMLTQRGSRRLLVYKKQREPIAGEAAYILEDPYANGTFRESMFVQGRTTNAKPEAAGDAPTV
uniref:UPF0020 domain-containing protein n=1 Tax=Panagrellus redivivus TaxID=6233 RepID=A0A7E4VN30_PANRE